MRSYTSAQGEALAATDRATYARVWFADADGAMQNVCSLLGEDFFDSVTIDANTDQPISSATFTLKRKSGQHSLVPLDENSLVNRDASGAYAPFLNPYRNVRVECATLASDAGPPAESDWVYLWQGITDEVDWGGESNIRVRARDPMARLNDTFIETAATYGANDGSETFEEVMQEILGAYISSPSMTLSYTATSNAVREYELDNVTVLAGLQELADMIGWNLTWKWDATASDLRLTLWEPARSSTASVYTFGTDDYYMIPRTSLNLEGIRNAGEVVYRTTAGVYSTASDTRTDSVALYGRRFIRIDARGTSVVTSTQADNLLSAVLDDLEEPQVLQEVDCAFFWPCELGDVYAFTPNDHYSTTQTYAVFGYRHVLSGTQKRTYLSVAGKPSGGYQRWHDKESDGPPSVGVIHHDTSSRSHTGDTDETELERVALPILYPGLDVRVRCNWQPSGTAGAKVPRIYLDDGSTQSNVAKHSIPAAETDLQIWEFVIQTLSGSSARSSWTVDKNSTSRYTPNNNLTIANELVFMVDLANAADTMVLVSTEVSIMHSRLYLVSPDHRG